MLDMHMRLACSAWWFLPNVLCTRLSFCFAKSNLSMRVCMWGCSQAALKLKLVCFQANFEYIVHSLYVYLAHL